MKEDACAKSCAAARPWMAKGTKEQSDGVDEGRAIEDGLLANGGGQVSGHAGPLIARQGATELQAPSVFRGDGIQGPERSATPRPGLRR